MIVNFGEYYDEVYAWAEKYNPHGAMLMRDWLKIDSGVSWERARAEELSDELVRSFACDMRILFDEHRDYHGFLIAAHSIAEKMGIEMDISEFDQPLDISKILGWLA